MAAIEERFQAAVNVIKGLPKNGPYQPSTSMMLKFYGLFKQATEGGCDQKKPGFWDIVGKVVFPIFGNSTRLSLPFAIVQLRSRLLRAYLIYSLLILILLLRLLLLGDDNTKMSYSGRRCSKFHVYWQ